MTAYTELKPDKTYDYGVSQHSLQTAYQALLFDGLCLSGLTESETAEALWAYATDSNRFSDLEQAENVRNLTTINHLKERSQLECFIDAGVQVSETDEERRVTAGGGYSLYQKEICLLEDSYALPLSYTGVQTNSHVAEYESLGLLLKSISEGFPHTHLIDLTIWSDSENLVNQINGESRVRNATIRKIRTAIRALLSDFRTVTIKHCNRTDNQRADELATLGSQSKRQLSIIAQESH